MKDFSSAIGTLPYASELFGIYQPLLGWQSKIIGKRVQDAQSKAYKAIASKVLNQARSTVTLTVEGEREVHGGRFREPVYSVNGLRPMALDSRPKPQVSSSIDSAVARLLSERLGATPPENWGNEVNTTSMTKLLDRLQEMLVNPEEFSRHPTVVAYVETFAAALEQQDRLTVLRALFDKETRIAGYLVFLAQHSPSQLTPLLFAQPRSDVGQLAAFTDPLLNFGSDAYRAILSPVGIVHLYREYFFEFDSFLGPPVGHVWLSPGGTIELVEVNTRKVFTERTAELAVETLQRSETSTTVQDDIADAVKEENHNDIKFGFTNTASYTVPVFQDTATATFSLDTMKNQSREQTHKQMRQQSEKLSSEIKRNFKTTFKTSTEVTDTTSKRYVIQNTTPRLVNYELRRKMRKVGVQVQDVGVQMCWHTFVDDPGRELGIANLVHIGERPDLSGLTYPEQPLNPGNEQQEVSFPIPFVGTDTDDNDQAYTNGGETEVGLIDEKEHIQADFPMPFTFTKPGYTLVDVHAQVVGADAKISIGAISSGEGSSTGSFNVHIDYVDWKGADSFTVKATLVWAPAPELADKIKTAYDTAVAQFKAENARRYKDAFYKAARDRIKAANDVAQRPTAGLREEERTVVYRRLISQLMKVAPSESRHVVSELVRSIFDVDKMLYFVAPEWWVPRLHRSTQSLGAEIKPPGTGGGAPATGAATSTAAAVSKFKASAVKLDTVLSYTEIQKAIADLGNAKPTPTPLPDSHLVDWGGAKEGGRDNYYITEDSRPARLGSSLGWLLQLDGDNLRNAMLNAPWVKAVIPIRIGKEKQAINWLRQAHVEGEEGLGANYVPEPGDPDELRVPGLTVLDVLTILSDKIVQFDQNSRSPIIANPANPDDPRNHYAGSLPTEAVFENGFYPLQGGVQFNQDGTEQAIFSQWMEILPTDQVAALEVEYDPKTLQVKVMAQPVPDNAPAPPVPPEPPPP